MLTIKDLSTSVELDRAALSEVRGGMELFKKDYYFGYPWGGNRSDDDVIQASIEQNALNQVEAAFAHVDADNNLAAQININS